MMKLHKLLIISLVICFSSCKTLQERCEDLFPAEVEERVINRKIVDTLLYPINTIEFKDTSICLPSVDTSFVVKTIIRQIPGDTIYLEYECIDTVLINPDQAKVNHLSEQLKITRSELKIASKGSNSKSWIIALLTGLISALTFLLIRRK